MKADLRSRLTKTFRVRGAGLRQVYHTWRRIERYFRDSPRRSMLTHLPPTTLRIQRDDGFLVVEPRTFPETEHMVRDARAALSRYDATMPPSGKNRKRFLQNVLDASLLTREAAAVRLALREDVIAAISQYLGVVPFLTSIQVFHSDTAEGVPTSSQLYHCDGDDVTQVKIFVYCSDVDVPSGPFTLLDAATTREVQRRTGYTYRNRLTDDEVRAAIGAPQEHVILGPTGTTLFVDTSRCFHFGSRVAPGAPARLATMIQYQTPYSFMLPPGGEDVALPFRRLLSSSMTPLQRLVLGE